ncbi:unnamed protein product [Acanthoscelides obtectus]|uniref:Uncharacterized protein n=1 Tax=Acanthoscelides obtectus TaxID=200917 RepID=A0A9P0M3V4_ACAOB|nr:unnamed protein product [Acanthoscelides obtectus]CAK1627296.1 hypothetical protein AOBTE_LOCUS4493 [Acanthoscelides obtectus]
MYSNSSCVSCVILILTCACCFVLSEFTSNLPSATTQKYALASTKSRYEQGLEDYDEAIANSRQSRGMMIADDHHYEEMKPEKKAVAEDPWASYYDFIINEGSFKFWAVFQLITAVLLIYSAFAAAYYAKFNVITTDYDYYDDYLGRSNNEPATSSLWSGLSSTTFQRILDAISSRKYT